MGLFTLEDDPMTVKNYTTLKKQLELNVDEYTKVKNPPTEVQRFYAGKSIFLTGATGFMGKCFVEKVLRDCSEIKHLYLLVRARKGFTIEEKMKKYFKNIIFERLRVIHPNFEDKVVLVEGDLGVENLGLSAEDRQMLIDNVNIMVHNGATVKFNEAVSAALKINVLSTRDMLELALACKHIEAFSYVSTAYSHCYMKHINEEFYEPAADLKIIYDMIAADQAAVNGLSEESTKMFLGKWPNIYTFTKSMSEDLVRKYGERADFACSVFRPSMVMSAYKEPFIGWIGNRNGPTAALLAGALGIVRVMYPSDIIDVVPVDYSINALIVSVFDATKQWAHEKRPRVYNFGSSDANPITVKKMYRYGLSTINTVGSSNTVWHKSTIFTANDWQFYILHFFLHFIPAIFADLVLFAMGKTPRALGICISATKNLHWIMHFSKFGWRIRVTEMRKAFDRISEQDRELFYFDIWSVSWKEFVSRITCGGKIFLLNEPVDNLEKGKRWNLFLKILHYSIVTVFYIFLAYFLMKWSGIIN